ncbi:hypothetical protein L2E82_50281 [Cichorium intybus]|nr:hypothetical protein L2E82_50281 [Cichorium intybus]
MDISVSGSEVRTDRSSQSPEPDSGATEQSLGTDRDSSSNPMGSQTGFNESAQNPSSNPSLDDEDSDKYCTEDQLEEIMLQRLELMYDVAISRLILASGCNKEIAVFALLRNGHCLGSMDPVTNIVNNTMQYLDVLISGSGNLTNIKPVSANLMQLREFSLIYLVCLVRLARPCLTRGDAMWCLIMTDLHLDQAINMKIAGCPYPNDDGDGDGDCNSSAINMENPLFSELITPSMTVLLKDNAAFLASEYIRLTSSSDVDSDTRGKALSKETLEILSFLNQEGAKIIMKIFHEMNREGDNKDDELLNLIDEMEDLGKQIKDKRKWVNEKEIQVMKRLSDDYKELRKLRMEREESQRIKPKRSGFDVDHPTMKNLIDVEIALRKAVVQLERAEMVVKRLEVENMEIRAEVVAFKLSSSESDKKYFEVSKREKKHLKKYLAWEKERNKLKDDIASEKQKLLELQEEMAKVEAARKTAEAKWREEQEAKKHALACLQQERRLKEETISNNKRIQESLRAKIDLDFKLHEDDIQRLEQELTRVKSFTDSDQDLISLFGANFEDDAIGRFLHGTGDDDDDESDDGNWIDRECKMCLNDEVTVVFLPCAHQVVCGGCNDELVKKADVKCPTCGAQIEERIPVFGSSS